jgi:hypothetical protein
MDRKMRKRQGARAGARQVGAGGRGGEGDAMAVEERDGIDVEEGEEERQFMS